MTTSQMIVLRYHEIAIKGDNRSWFEDRLALNVKKQLEKVHGKEALIEVKRYYGRITVKAPWNDLTQKTLTRVFGISNFSPMTTAKTELNALLEKALQETRAYIQTNGIPKSFCVRTRRSDKALPEKSHEINTYIGSAIHDEFPCMQVDLKNPELTIGIEVRTGESFFWIQKLQGSGGLPVGTNGPVLTLMSGGIDSPVAAIQILKRGSCTSFIHFYGTPFVGEEVLTKIEDLVKLVNRFQPNAMPLYVIPFGKIQEKIALVTNPKLRTVLYRRMMIRIANQVAKRLKLQALITGESVGQVASQTVENISVINEVSEIPIFRPLITYDKSEIMLAAQKWGTFETSIQPVVDCCTLFADRHPSLRTSIERVQEEETHFPVEELVNEALSNLIIKNF